MSDFFAESTRRRGTLARDQPHAQHHIACARANHHVYQTRTLQCALRRQSPGAHATRWKAHAATLCTLRSLVGSATVARAPCEQQRCSSEQHYCARHSSRGYSRRRRAQKSAPHSWPDILTAHRSRLLGVVDGSDLRPRLPSWHLVWLTQVWCVSLSVRLGCYQPVHGPIESCMECEHGMRVPSSSRVGRANGRKNFYCESRPFLDRSILGSSRGAQNCPFRL